ncbi:MAG: glycosyltransferase family 39 protein [Candidatus Omnitrophica bacterium]|nr:glycosyltransferase family 39 protein [Candidatus Omnitrophota bacterium]
MTTFFMGHSKVLTERFGLGLILTIAFLLRVWGVGFGLPELYHADEPVIVNHALAYGTGDLNPHFFKIPPLISYLLFFVYGVVYLIGRGIGVFNELSDFGHFFIGDPTFFYLIGRILFGIFIGTLTVYFFYRLIAKHFSKRDAFLSSLLLAANFLHVRDSHYLYVDIPLLCLLVLSFIPILNILDRKSRNDYFLFGVLFGAAVAVKYNGIFVFIPFVTAHFARSKFKLSGFLDRNFWMSVFVAVITFVFLNPFSVIDSRFFLAEILAQGKAEGPVGWMHHLAYSLLGGLGFLICGLAIFGVVTSFFDWNWKVGTLLSFLIVYYIVLALFSQPYDRYVLPVVPFLLFFAALGIRKISDKFKFNKRFFCMFVAIVLLPSLVKVYLCNQIFLADDVRASSKKWIEENIPYGSKIALDSPFFMPRLKPTLAQLQKKEMEVQTSYRVEHPKRQRVRLMIEEAKKQDRPRYELYFLKGSGKGDGFLFSTPEIPYDLDELKKRHIKYVIVAKINESYNKSFYLKLSRETNLFTRFSPYRDGSREWPVDSQPLTGAPFLWRELVSRRCNGQILEVYKLD